MEELYHKLLSLLERRDDLESAALALEEFHQQEPDSQRTAVLEAVLKERQGRIEEAVGVLENFIARCSDNAVARSNLARLYWKTGDSSKALSSLRFALIQNPNQERSLHLYASWLESQSQLSGALSGLALLSQTPGAHLPAWVAAILSEVRAPERIAELLLLSARQATAPFPPDLDTFARLLAAVPETQRRTTAQALRPFCHQQAVLDIDELLAQTTSAVNSQRPTKSHRLQRSVWRHLSAPLATTSLGLAPVCLISPQKWGVLDLSGKLGRGFALLTCEMLDSLQNVSCSALLETVPESGLLRRDTPHSGESLALPAEGSCERLVSTYLSFQEPDQFLLDAELYSAQGHYLGRHSFRALHPGECLRQLAEKLVSLFPGQSSVTDLPPPPHLDIDDALARDAVASLILCAEGALEPTTLGNPGLILDNLVQYALQSGDASSMLCLWAGIEAAARAGLPSGQEQRAAFEEILKSNSSLTAWIS